MPKVIRGIWEPPPGNENQWEVRLGALMYLTVNAKSHQVAKRIALDYWASCCANPKSFMDSLQKRIEEQWGGGLHAKLRHRAPLTCQYARRPNTGHAAGDRNSY